MSDEQISPPSYGYVANEMSATANEIKEEGVCETSPLAIKDGMKERKSGFVKATFNIFCAGAGAGIVGLPFAMKCTGWYGTILLVATALICVYTGYKMAFCYNDPSLHLVTYNDFGERALGIAGSRMVGRQFLGHTFSPKVERRMASFGSILVGICQVGVCVGSCTLYLVFAGDNLKAIFKNIAPIATYQWVLICGAIVLPLCFLKTLHDVAPVSILGALASVAVVVVLMVDIFTMPPDMQNHTYTGIGFDTFLKGFATITFAYGAHNVFPSVQRTMHKPKQMGMSSATAFLGMFILYTLTACIGYYAFGNQAHPNVLLNLQPGRAPSIIIQAALTIHVLFAIGVYINPVYELLDGKISTIYYGRESLLVMKSVRDAPTSEGIFSLDDTQKGETLEPVSTPLVAISTVVDSEIMGGKTETIAISNKFAPLAELESSEASIDVPVSVPETPSKKGWTSSFRRIPCKAYVLFFRLFVFAIIVFLAILIPFFGDLMSLIGAATVAASVFMFPAGFYAIIYWHRIGKLDKALCLTIVLLGTFAAVVASIFAIRDIISKASTYAFFKSD